MILAAAAGRTSVLLLKEGADVDATARLPMNCCKWPKDKGLYTPRSTTSR